MGMGRERGSIGIYMLFSLAAAILVGYGVYRVLHEQRLESAQQDAAAAAHSPRVASHGAVAAPPLAPAEVEPAEAVAPAVTFDDRAERDAADPPDFDDPDKDTVVFGQPGITGTLERAGVERTIKRYLVRYERCFRRHKESYRVRRSTVRLALAIDPTGRVTQGTARVTGVEQGLGDCVIDVVRRLRFDKPTDGGSATVIYPIVFAPANGGTAGDSLPPGAEAGCDEVACVLNNYEGDCCAKYNRGQ